MSKPVERTSGSDDFDLSTEKLVAPEINSVWWPEPVPTEGPAPAP